MDCLGGYCAAKFRLKSCLDASDFYANSMVDGLLRMSALDEATLTWCQWFTLLGLILFHLPTLSMSSYHQE